MNDISSEDYLRMIYTLSENLTPDEGVSSTDIAKRLDITKASVSEKLKRLKAEGLVDYEPYSKVFLTQDGKKRAKLITHNYRVIGVFLTKILDYHADEIEQEAHLLEHAFSQDSIHRLEAYLGNPELCPHGSSIH